MLSNSGSKMHSSEPKIISVKPQKKNRVDTVDYTHKTANTSPNSSGVAPTESSGQEVPNGSPSTFGCSATYWQIVSIVSCFLANMFTGGIGMVYGILYEYMKDSLDVTDYELSWIGSIFGGTHGLASVLGTILIDSLGCKVTTLLGGVIAFTGFAVGSQVTNIYVLYITLGFLPGIGISLCYTATIVYMNAQFSRWRPVAVGLSVTGIAVGVLTWPHLTSGISDIMGWRGTILVTAALTLHLIPAGLWIQARKKTVSHNEPETRQITFRKVLVNYFKIFKIPGCVTVSLTHFFIGLSFYTFTTFIPSYVSVSVPLMSSSEISFIVSAVGIGSLFGRLVFTTTALVHPSSSRHIFIISLCMSGMANLLVPVCKDIGGFLADSIFYGQAFGGYMSISSLVFVELFGLENLSKTFGTFMMCIGLGSYCGPPFQSYVSTLLGMEETSFYSAGCFYLISAMLMVPLTVKKKSFLRKRQSVNITVISPASVSAS